ncbi:hypothetical protein D3C71_2242770 [compost metagenome]
MRSVLNTWAVRLFSRYSAPVSSAWFISGMHSTERARCWRIYGSVANGAWDAASPRNTLSRVRKTW